MLKETKTKQSGHVHLSINPYLKEDAEILLKQMGLSMAEAVRLFLRQVVVEEGIPFSVKYSANIPNYETRQAILDARNGKTKKTSITGLRKMWDEA
jgi:addiction module RelB/DinJ family antitoxin